MLATYVVLTYLSEYLELKARLFALLKDQWTDIVASQLVVLVVGSIAIRKLKCIL